MTTTNMKKYLTDVLGREQVLFTLNSIKNDINQRMHNIIHSPKSISAPHPPNVPATHKGSVKHEGSYALFIIGILVIFICIFAGLFNSVFWGIGLVVFIAIILFDDAYERKVIAERKERYSHDYNNYEAEKRRIENENERLKEEQAAELMSLRTIQADVELHINKTQSTLEALYALDILFGKYRYFVAVASICEYFQSGRCDSLEGHEGAYNLYENELRQNIIIGQLSKVIKELQQIRNAQYLLYEAINASNQIQQNIAIELNNINRNSIKANQSIINRLDDIKGSVDNSAKSSAMVEYFTKETANNSRLMVEINRGDYGLLFDKKGNVVYTSRQ